MILETERLILREMGQSDFGDLAGILQDPEVVYAYEHHFTDQDVQEWLDRQIKRYETDGFGLWALILKTTGEMVGQAGLTMQPCRGEEVLEIGYLLKKKYWHHGYATEAAMGCRNYAFDRLNQDKVYSIIKADNELSKRVARNIGMKKILEFVTQYYNGDMLHELYCVEKMR